MTDESDPRVVKQTTDLLGLGGLSSGLGCLLMLVAIGVLFNFGRVLDLVQAFIERCH
jgi:hypothetical protein